MKTEYRGFEITEVFKYNNGTSDWQIQRISDPEQSGLVHRNNIEGVKRDIDFRLEESPEIYSVRINLGTESLVYGLFEALAFAQYWKGNLLADFCNP